MIKIFSQLCLFGFLITFFTTGLVFAQASSNNLIISEVAYKGTISQDNCKVSSSSTFNCGHDKWVELYNPTSSSIDLSKYRLAYGRQGEDYTENRQLSGTVSPNGYFVVANKTNNSLTNLPEVNLLMSNMHFMSANSGDKYLKVSILDSKAQVIAKVELNNSQINSLESGLDFGQNRFSIEFKNGIPSVNQSNSYGRSPEFKNYGTPGFGFLVPVKESPKPISKAAPVIAIEKPIQVIPSPQPVAPVVILPTKALTPVVQSAPVESLPLPHTSNLVTQATPELIPVSQVNLVQSVETKPVDLISSQIVPIPAKVNSFVNGDNIAVTTKLNTENNKSTSIISIPRAVNYVANSVNIPRNNISFNLPMTQAIVTAKVSQSHYELILTLIAIGVVIFVGYIVFDYNYNRIEQYNLDKFTNIVSY